MSRQRHWYVKAAVALLAAAVLTLSACTSSGNSSSGGTSAGGGTGNTASGTPLKIGIQLPIKAVVDYSEAVSAAQGAVRAINAAGGVDGHPLQLETCNTQLNPTQEQACARKMISDKVVAMVGNANYTAEQTVNDLFKAAGIAQ